jgi:NTE family protein
MGDVLNADRSRSDFLAVVPVFAGLPEQIRDFIAEHSRWIQVTAGEWLFRQGEPGDSLYVVRSGRLEIVVEQPEWTVVRVLGRGAALGELALLTGTPRSASVRARRDSELLVVDRSSFTELLSTEPEFALALTRELGHQLQESRALTPPVSPQPSIITFAPLGSGVGIERICEAVRKAMSRWHTVAVLDGRDGHIDASEHGGVVDRTERDNDRVLLVAGMPGSGDSWTEFCLRQSDRVIGVVGAGASPPGADSAAELRGCDLLVEGDVRGAALSAWVDAFEPRATHFASAGGGFERGLERLARRLAGRSVGVVLSGGGARGFAHVGVLAELVDSGVTIDRVAGCSMGAYIGAMFAMERDCEAMRAHCQEEFVLGNPLGDYTLPIVSLVRGQRARAMLERTFGEESTIEELPRDYFCVSADLLSGDLVVHRRGFIYEAVGASMCLPGIFAPVARKKGYLLVDGGVLNNLPVEPMAATAEGPVIAVDVSARFLPPGARPGRRRGRPRIRQWTERTRRTIVGWEEPLPRLNETLTRSIGIGGVEANERARRGADMLIEPATGGIGLLDWAQLDHMVEIGRRAAAEALESAPQLVSG